MSKGQSAITSLCGSWPAIPPLWASFSSSARRGRVHGDLQGPLGFLFQDLTPSWVRARVFFGDCHFKKDNSIRLVSLEIQCTPESTGELPFLSI